MIPLSTYQYKILKEIYSNSPLHFDKLSKREHDLEVFEYLSVEKFIKVTKKSELIEITERGKSYLFMHRKNSLTFVLAILSLIFSTISIVLSPFFNIFFTKLFGLQ